MKNTKENFDILLNRYIELKLTANLANIKQKCTRKSITFNLKPEDLKPYPMICPVLGTEIDWLKEGNGPSDDSPSIDRLDPALGYTKDNCFIISAKANRIKNNGSVAEIKKVASWLESKVD